MTRTARTPKKKYLPASNWEELKGAGRKAPATDKHGAKGETVSAGREKRREQRRMRRMRQKICFLCRKYGHSIADCPKASEQGVGVCFKCGSTEHISKDCRAKANPNPEQGDFPFAKCFICGETGHLSKQCSENPRGIYPKGGCCRLCGSVEHKRTDCPEAAGARSEKQSSAITLKQRQDFESADAVDDEGEKEETAPAPKKKPKHKVVRF